MGKFKALAPRKTMLKLRAPAPCPCKKQYFPICKDSCEEKKLMQVQNPYKCIVEALLSARVVHPVRGGKRELNKMRIYQIIECIERVISFNGYATK